MPGRWHASAARRHCCPERRDCIASAPDRDRRGPAERETKAVASRTDRAAWTGPARRNAKLLPVPPKEACTHSDMDPTLEWLPSAGRPLVPRSAAPRAPARLAEDV